jgi:hypothetical protein
MSELKIKKSQIDVTPNVNFLTTLRNSGYNNYTAIADIVDNSLDTDVNSKNVRIIIKKSKEDYDYIKICDDGCGMDINTLDEAFKLGAITGKNKTLDLGSYGTGLKAAALSIGRKFEIRTKSIDDAFYVAIYDLDVLLSDNIFEIPVRVGTEEEYQQFKDEVKSENGTIVTLSNLDRVTNTNSSIFKDTLKNKLSLIYKYFIDELNIKIYVNNEIVESFDPMFRKENYTKCLTSNEKFKYGEHDFKFSVYDIEFINSAISTSIGRNQSNAGLYIYRNNRLVGAGLDLGMIGKLGDGHLNGLRIELFVNGDCDDLFGSTFNKIIHEKDKKDIDQGFKDVCQSSFKPYIKSIKSKEENKETANEPSDDVKKELDVSIKSINENPFTGIQKLRGMNTKREIPSTSKDVKNPGSKPGQTRVRNDKFCDYRFIRLGENGLMFRTVKEHGLYILEINQEHPFWVKFMSKASLETKDVMLKLLISLGVSLEDTEYYNDTEKEILLNEYFIKVSERLRKFILY